MEAFNFFKLWKTSPVVGNVIPPPEYDDEDAFFDLELNYEPKHLNNSAKVTQVNNNSESDEEDEFFENSPKSTGGARSPISFLRSPPKFPVFSKFRKSKMSVSGDESPAPGTPVLSRSNSRKAQGPNGVVRKYIKLMKIRISGERISREFAPESPSRKVAEDRQRMRSPSLRIVCRRLGKSRNALPAGGVVSVGSPGGDLVVQSDGIQSAILHCKRSYNSSKDLSVLSRSVSEPVITANPSRFSIEEMKRISI